MSYLTAIGLLVFVLSPLLVPVCVTIIHAVVNWRRSYGRLRAVLRPTPRALDPAV